MRPRAFPAVIGALLLLVAPALVHAQTSEAKPGTIRGTITAADTGKPLRRARVTVVAVAGRPSEMPPVAYTNSLGRYELRNVAPGSYYVSARRAGYVEVQHGQRHVGERGLAVDLAAGGVVEGIDVALPRGSVLGGRITDDLGEPYPGVRVDLIALRYNLGKRQPFPVDVATTDDLGQFRLAGVAPGRYYLSASSNETWRDSKKETYGYATTFYPGVPIEQAELLTVGVSELKTELNFSLHAGRAARIRGRVQRENGAPVAGGVVSLAYSYPGAIIVAGGRTTRTAPDGSFEFREVPGGIYNISDQTVTVTGADIDDLVIVSKTGSSVSGVVVADDGGPPPFSSSGVRVLNHAPTGKVLPRVAVASVDASWSFKFTNLGGPFLFRLMGLPDGWMLGSVRLGEKDITDAAWDVPTGSKVFEGLRITVTPRVGTVSGTVVDDKGRPTAAAVILFSEDEAHWHPYSRFVHTVRPGADGRFSITGLPAATYRAVVRDYIETGQHEDRSFLEEIRDDGVRVVLSEGGTERLALKLEKR